MSLAYEAPSTRSEPVETAIETHELTAWFADAKRQATEQMPNLSEISLQRLNGLIGDDQEFDFMSAMTNLYDIKDKNLQEATCLYMCGYSEQDLELMAPDVPIADIEETVNRWRSYTENTGSVSLQNKKITRRRESTRLRPPVRKDIRFEHILGFIDPTLIANDKWEQDAECKDADYTQFDVPDGEKRVITSQRAYKVEYLCGRCAVKMACLTDAVVNNNVDSIRVAQPPHVLRRWHRQYKEHQVRQSSVAQ